MSSVGASMVVLGLLCGCSKSMPPAGTQAAIDGVCDGADQSRVRLTGYVRYRRGLLSFCSSYGGHKTCDLALYAAPEAPPDFDIMHPAKGPEPVYAKLSVPVGHQPGEMAELPKKFAPDDVRLYLPNGASIGEGGHVRIDGTLKVIPGDPKAPAAAKQCYINVEWATGA